MISPKKDKKQDLLVFLLKLYCVQISKKSMKKVLVQEKKSTGKKEIDKIYKQIY